MNDPIEMIIRLACFVGVFALLALLETQIPRRAKQNRQRWFGNIGLSVLSQLCLRLLMPVTNMALAALLVQQQIGLLNWLDLPLIASLIIALLLLDLAIYGQHRLFHRMPFFWRWHRVHHADTELDVSSGIRFHPGSIIFSALIKLGAIVLIGPPVMAVLVFEIMLNASSLFNHSNIHIPERIDRWLRLIIVTPDVHRVHHSSTPAETDSNFGFNFPWWDRLFGTYRAQPRQGHQCMEIGLDCFRDKQERGLLKLLSQPFRRQLPGQ